MSTKMLKINTYNPVNRAVYAYTTPNDKSHNGWIKIGDTEVKFSKDMDRAVKERIYQQTGTSNTETDIKWTGRALFENDNAPFRDYDFHKYLTDKQGIERMNAEHGHTKRPEWFKTDGNISEFHFFKFRKNHGILTEMEGVEEYELRKEQEDAAKRTADYFKNHKLVKIAQKDKAPEFLWNAKPRFGKTLTAYDFCKRIGAKNVLVLTNRPAIADSWYDDYAKFVGTEGGYYFVSQVDIFRKDPKKYKYVLSRRNYIEAQKQKKLGCIEFISLQDLKGANSFGGEHEKLREVSELDWDVLVLDEAHEGVDTDKTEQRKQTSYEGTEEGWNRIMSKWCHTLQRKHGSTYSVAFHPLLLSDTKRDEIIHRAKEIRDMRNDISQMFFDDMLGMMELSKFEAFNKFTQLFTERISSHYLKKCIEDVWRAYQIRFDAIKHKIEFRQVVSLTPIFYKRNAYGHKVGELKSVERRTKTTPLTRTLTYLARYGTYNAVDYINAKLETAEGNKKLFYEQLLSHINKFGFERLMRLALFKRQSVFNEYKNRGAITFESLSFSGRSRITRPVVAPNRGNTDSRLQYFVEISWDWTNQNYHKKSDTMCIPVKYSKSYHRSLARYCNGTDTSYNMIIRGNRLHIVLTRDGYRYTSDSVITDENTVGIDVNSKHNMFADSRGTFIPNDDELVKELQLAMLEVDAKQKAYDSHCKPTDPKFKTFKKDSRRIDAISKRLNESNTRTIVNMIRCYASSGIKHIAMENLDGFQGQKLYADNELGVNLGRLFKRVGLSSLKNIVEHIAPKYGLSLSLVQPEYTSIQCGCCGRIDERNRPNQETFECVECGHHMNADLHSAQNIKRRLTSTVLRGNLLNLGNVGYRNFMPKSLARCKVREFLEKCRYNGLYSSPQKITTSTSLVEIGKF